MKASEYIHKLQDMITQYGDLDIARSHDGNMEAGEIIRYKDLDYDIFLV